MGPHRTRRTPNSNTRKHSSSVPPSVHPLQHPFPPPFKLQTFGNKRHRRLRRETLPDTAACQLFRAASLQHSADSLAALVTCNRVVSLCTTPQYVRAHPQRNLLQNLYTVMQPQLPSSISPKQALPRPHPSLPSLWCLSHSLEQRSADSG